MTVRLLEVNAHGADSSVGGAEMYVKTLSRELASRNFELNLLSAFPGRVPSFFGRSATLHATHWRDDPIRRLRNHAGDFVCYPSRRLFDAVKSFHPDLVHTNNLPGITSAIWEVCQRLGVPVVHTLHDYHLLCPRVTLMRADGERCRPHPLICGLRSKRLARWSGAVSEVISVSRYLLDEHRGVFSGARAHVVRNPLPRTRAGAFSPPGARLRTIGYLGALEAIKGVDQLLAAAPELMRLGYKLRLAGEGRMRPAVEQAAAHSPGVAYDGVVAGPAKEAFLQRCDLGIMPSVWAEPGGPSFAMVEWLSAGRPAVVSNRGGLGEAVNLFPGAIAVEPTAQGIVAALAPLLDETAWRRAVERVRRPDSAEDGLNRWVCEHERILRSALGERRRRT